MDVMDVAKHVLKQGYVCDHCLGRQFAQLLSGLTNKERGRSLRLSLAMELETGEGDMDMANFHGLGFRKRKSRPKPHGDCVVCNGLFDSLSSYIPKVTKSLQDVEFKTFLVGTKVSPELVNKEERLWEATGIEWCEQLRAEVNREFGKMVEKELGKVADLVNPDVEITLDLERKGVETRISSVFVYGGYKKLVRGIPQTKWDTYKVTVEDIMAKPFMAATGGSGHSLHGSGREDIDARCLDWRPFVLEIKAPKKRDIDLKALEKKVNRSSKIQVHGLRFSGKGEVRKVKAEKREKTYRLTVSFAKPLEKLSRLSALRGEIKQHTPARVLHRRADLLRKRRVTSIAWKKISPRTLVFTIRAESGLYVKELATGDGGRTKPSAAELLDNPVKIKSLDVIKVWGRK